MTRDEVLNHVRTAFAGLPAPPDPADASDEALADCGIHLLGQEAVRYHVPRIIDRSLREARRPAGDGPFHDLVYFLRHVNRQQGGWQIGLFDAHQRTAILSLLRFLDGNAEHLGWEELKLVKRAIPLWEVLC